VQVFNGTWLSEHEIVYVDQNGSIVIFDADTNKSSSMLVKTYDKTLHTMARFKLSADRQSLLFMSDMRYEFGAPVAASYGIFNISSQTVEFLDDLVKINNPMRTPRIQYATWGPNSNSIVFIESNDIYYVPDFAASHSGSGSSSSAAAAATPATGDTGSVGSFLGSNKYMRLTKTGSISDSIRNGMPDSLYRAHIFNQPNEATIWWSPDGRYLAYLSFDDALVEPSPIEYYDTHPGQQQPHHQQQQQPSDSAGPGSYLPGIHYEKYPRAGGINPRVSVHVVDLSASSTGGDSGDIEQSTILAPSELIKQQQLDQRLGYYVTYVGWLAPAVTGAGQSHPNRLLVMWSNRAQSMSMLSQCENTNERGSLFGSRANAWKCDILTTFSQRIPPNLDAKQTILSSMNANGTRLIFFALPRPDSIIGDHYHVAMLKGDERAPKYLTHGEFDIDRLISYDAEADALYFEAKIGDKAERHLYQISSVTQIARRRTRCLTCELDEPCGYNSAHIAPGARYFVHECLGPSVPKTYLRLLKPRPAAAYNQQTGAPAATLVSTGAADQQPASRQPAAESTANNNQNGTIGMLSSINVLGSNPHIEQLMRTKQMPIEKFIAIKSNQQVPCDAYIKLYLPNEIDEDKDKRFPLLIESSEIDTHNVWKRFDLDWGKYLASKKQIIYARMDCIRTRASSSGSAAAGGGPAAGYHYSSSASASSGRLDDDQALANTSPLFNAKDQVDAIKFMADNVDLFPYIDRRRIAIWGPNSAAAYVALATTINDDSKLIQCTIAVSPITNWRYMSSYAAEHYLGLPWLNSNSLKYEQANLLRRSYEFSLRKLLIVHGTADEQVHVQHSMQFIKSLTEHHITGGVLHQMQLYPDVGHSLEHVRRHFYLTLDGFVDRCFYQKPIAIKATEWKGKVRPKLY
jgi:dipeptidyl aminopeptidase/acylaminoacyl peptidase